jgi:DNA-binding NarL/FixJ family response regulator
MTMHVAVVSDLLFASRVSAIAHRCGADCQRAGTGGELDALLANGDVSIVIIDMGHRGETAADTISGIAARYATTQIIAVYPHVHAELADRAIAAGASAAWAHSAVDRKLSELLAQSAP